MPITETSRIAIKELMQQWNSNSFDQIGYSYKPMTPDVEQMLKDHWKDSKVHLFNKELA